MSGNDEEQRSVRAAVEGELRLLDPGVRVLPEAVTELLDPEFTEFGASGRCYDRVSVLAVTSAGGAEGRVPVAATDMTGALLAPGLVHLTFTTESDGRRVRRNSIWRRTESRWRLYFHQGTPVNSP
ncbi:MULTISPECIES: DUF4440 domain-containing protein [unclassified Streptomyces]|uniref:nuclear transport factor 2 family protein n=1 Tax=unclassified Streptomyces TaxID=2593676 RepID=UPI00203480ED|nr:DUF4440 domain-containing protein [Streptomyces sp. RKAG290]MCM2410309.1 DUF4440 domain-containing protein [Streptomyces sp. RKAG290]